MNSPRKSIVPQSTTSQMQKDQRPIREKTFQLNCIKNILEYLLSTGYDKPISAKILSAPTSKDFQNVFCHFYSRIDSTYECGKKMEDEIPSILKGIRYPYANDISKSQLLAVGSMHAWPSLLGMLSWLVDLLKVFFNLHENLISISTMTII